MPPAVDLGAPLPPAAVRSHGFDAVLAEHFWLDVPFTPSFRAAGVLPLGPGAWGLELGGNLGVSWLGAAPALHWAPDPRPDSAWRWGGRLGLALGVGDLTHGDANPYTGASLLAQASRTWGPGGVGALTAALGWGYSGHLRCFFGCYIPDPEVDPEHEDPWSGEDYIPYNGPTLHLRLDLPLGRQGTAVITEASAQPVVWGGDFEPVWSLALGLHHRRVGLN
jgi:hypothetical protein